MSSSFETSVIFKTDLRGSTPLFRGLSDTELGKFLQQQKQLVITLTEEHNGRIIKGEGDAFWIVFPSVTVAVQTAVAIQQELRRQQSGRIGDDRIALRIVIALGDVLHQDGDIFGYPVNLTSRIESITPADEIYLSQVAWLALNKAEIETEYVDDFSFKGVADPEPIYRVVQPIRTKILPDQIIVVADVGQFSTLQKNHHLTVVENVLLTMEQMVRAVCHEQGGIVRFATGDMYFFTFTEATAALTAVTDLATRWREFIMTHNYPCTLSIGIHRGEIYTFRAYLYGEAMNYAVLMEQLNRHLPDTGAVASVTMNETVIQQIKGTTWMQRLRPFALTDLDLAHLEGKISAETIYRLEWESLAGSG